MQLALEYQEQHNKQLSRVVVFSDFDQQTSKKTTYKELALLFQQKKIDKLLAVGIDKKSHTFFENLNIIFFEKSFEWCDCSIRGLCCSRTKYTL